MAHNDPIEVCQFSFPGNKNYGKWFVCRGNGINTEYLRDDGTWHKSTISGNFFWDTKSEAEKAKRTVIEQESTPPP